MTAVSTQFLLQYIHVVFRTFQSVSNTIASKIYVIIILSKVKRILVIMLAFKNILMPTEFHILKTNCMSYWSMYENNCTYSLTGNSVLSWIQKSWKKAIKQMLEPQNKLSYLMLTASSSQAWRRDSKEKYRSFSTIQKFFHVKS